MDKQEGQIRHSIISGFHNQKEPDFNSKNGVLYGGGEKGDHRRHAYKESVEREKTIGEPSTLEDIISMSVLILKNIDLKPEAKEDEEQIKLLDKRREFALSKIDSLLKDINQYVISINALDTIKIQREEIDQKDYVAQIKMADEHRTQMHNSLMRNMQSTIKYIQYNFGKINESALEKWEEEQEEKDIPILAVQRMTFPPKVICPEDLNLDDRKQITAWAAQLSLSLGKLKK